MWDQIEQHSEEEPSGKNVPVSSVAQDEMAFAIALFFAATRGQVPLPNSKDVGFELRRERQTGHPELGRLEQLSGQGDAGLDDISLAAAVAVIWHHYEGATQQQAICSRLVAFYALMSRSKGTVADNQSHSVEGDPSSIALEPAVIRAVATAPLSTEGQFQDLDFRKLVMEVSDDDLSIYPTLSSIRTKVQLPAPVTDIVQDLVELLFACEFTIAVSESAESSHFKVFEKLCEPFSAVTGAQNLQPLLARALVLIHPTHPWLTSARVSQSGHIEGLDKAFLDGHPQEALRAELALMASLVQLLRSLLGDGVTNQLIRSVWPAAFMNTATPTLFRP